MRGKPRIKQWEVVVRIGRHDAEGKLYDFNEYNDALLMFRAATNRPDVYFASLRRPIDAGYTLVWER
jgi:hypothetical protein